MNDIKKYTPPEKVKWLAVSTTIWLITIAIAAFGPKLLWDNQTSITLLAIALNLLAGLFVIKSNLQHWNSLDEMLQRVQLNAMGIALGLGIFGGISFSLLETSDIIQTEFDLSFMVILMALSYLISTMVGMKRLG
ncbi:MAG TPA: hypothetical protein VKM37_06645 [Balneolaceae bacterium]|nr:hypothetical protein [Balneolaceae bacterium]